MRILVLFNLKAGVDPAKYENWALTRDIPGVRVLPSVEDFRVYRTTGMLVGKGKPPYAYFELLDIIDMAEFQKDAATDAVERLAAEFSGYADNPCFILSHQLP